MDSNPTTSQRVLFWDANNDFTFDASRRLPEQAAVEAVGSRAEFLLKFVQQHHQIAIVVCSDPFSPELQSLRQFNRLKSGAPVVLVLADCPFPITGFEQEFFAIVRDHDSDFELRQVFEAAMRHSEVAKWEQGSDFQRSGQQQNKTIECQLQKLKSLPVVNIVGEIGTAKTLLARQLHQMRGGTEKECLSFYCGKNNKSTIKTISDLIERPAQQATQPITRTFVLRNPNSIQARQAIALFHENPALHVQAEEQTETVVSNQLIMLNETSEYKSTPFALNLIPLRQRKKLLHTMAASILTGFNELVPELYLSMNESTNGLLREHDWPGNLCEFNLVIANAILQQSIDREEMDIILDESTIEQQLNEFSNENELIREKLRNRLNSASDMFVRKHWGTASQIRNMLNQTIFQNANLSWAFGTSSEIEALRRSQQTKRYAA